MGVILCSRQHEQDRDKVVVEVLVCKTEYRQLRGELDNVRLFSDRTVDVPSKVSLRGRNEATRYFLIPRQLRQRLTVQGHVSCQRIDNDDGRSIFVYVLDPCSRRRDTVVLP